MKNILFAITLICIIGCFITGKYLPISDKTYRTDGENIYFQSNNISLILSGKYGRPDQYSQASTFEVRFSDIKDTLTLIVSDVKLFSDSDSTKSFRLIDVNGPGGHLEQEIRLLPSENYQITFYYVIRDPSLGEPHDHIKQVTFMMNYLQSNNGEQISFPKFYFQAQ